MHLLATSLAFLIIFALFSYAQVQKLQELIVLDKSYSEHFQEGLSALHTRFHEQAKKIFGKLHPKKDPPDPGATRRTSFLHIHSLVKINQQSLPPPAATAQKLLVRLMIALYEDCAFFKEANMNEQEITELVDFIVANGEALATKHLLTDKQALANIYVDDPIKRTVLYKMLKGNMSEAQMNKNGIGSGETYPSLCEFVSIEDKNKGTVLASIYLAPRAILQAIFQDKTLVEEILTERYKIYLEYKKDDSKKVACQTAFKNAFINKVPHDIGSNLLDFDISKTAPPR